MTATPSTQVSVNGAEAAAGALFIHGAASSGRIWSRLLESGGARGDRGSLRSVLRGQVLTPDIPGMAGDLVATDRRVSFGYWMDYFRQAAGGRPMHLAGHSLGGAIAILLAREPWVASIALIAPVTRAYCENRRRVAVLGTNPGSIVLSGHLGKLVKDPTTLSRQEARMLREDYANAAPLLAAGVPWPTFAMDEADYLRGKRVLLVYGEEDAVVPPAYFGRMREELESASVDVATRALPRCGHIPQLERSVEVADLLRAFWTG